jgi:integrase
MKALAAKQVRDLQPADKRQRVPVGDVTGLFIEVSTTGAKKWILRKVVSGRRTDLGLGSYPTVSLSDARHKARELILKIDSGFDPQQEKRDQLKAIEQTKLKSETFEQLAEQYHSNVIQHELTNKKAIQQWINTIRQYANPVIGKRQIEDITERHIIKILKPIWFDKAETASRLRQRIVKVVNYGIRKQKLNIRNVAEWVQLEGQLPKSKSIINKIKKHQPALPVEEVPAFIQEIRQRTAISARLLEFIILNGCRFNEAGGALWSELDLNERVLVIPAERMKANKQHTLPLSDASMELLTSLPRDPANPFIFQPPQAQRFSDMACTQLIRRMNRDSNRWLDSDGRTVVTHGFRSAFKEWARSANRYNHTPYDDEVSELQMAHVNSDSTRAAYARGSLLDERREMMSEWADYCEGKTRAKVSEIPTKLNKSVSN